MRYFALILGLVLIMASPGFAQKADPAMTLIAATSTVNPTTYSDMVPADSSESTCPPAEVLDGPRDEAGQLILSASTCNCKVCQWASCCNFDPSGGNCCTYETNVPCGLCCN